MAKMTRAERSDCEKNLAICRSAVTKLEKMLADDDAEGEKAAASSDATTIKAIAQRDGTAAGILAARELGRRGGPAE